MGNALTPNACIESTEPGYHHTMPSSITSPNEESATIVVDSSLVQSIPYIITHAKNWKHITLVSGSKGVVKRDQERLCLILNRIVGQLETIDIHNLNRSDSTLIMPLLTQFKGTLISSMQQNKHTRVYDTQNGLSPSMNKSWDIHDWMEKQHESVTIGIDPTLNSPDYLTRGINAWKNLTLVSTRQKGASDNEQESLLHILDQAMEQLQGLDIRNVNPSDLKHIMPLIKQKFRGEIHIECSHFESENWNQDRITSIHLHINPQSRITARTIMQLWMWIAQGNKGLKCSYDGAYNPIPDLQDQITE